MRDVELTGDELLKELGYDKIEQNEEEIKYEHGYTYITFNLEDKSYIKYGYDLDDNFEIYDVSINELKAINKKAEELGWN